MKKQVLLVFGTRPEAIKMAPLVKAFAKDDRFDSKVCVTAQHREMLDQVLSVFNIEPDFDLDVMSPSQSLISISTKILTGLEKVFAEFNPDYLIVHGDTSTTLAASIAAFYSGIKVVHIEAGLRTGDLYSPWPEEANRKVTSCVSALHFAPTERAKQNLIAEGYSDEAIHVVGNTVIDALLEAREKIKVDSRLTEALESDLAFLADNKKMILITGHRRENIGDGFVRICSAIARLAAENPDIAFVYPVHLNPNVKGPVESVLGSMSNIYLIEPQEYLQFVYLMDRAFLILTDSGGVQEEAPSLGKPVVLLRDTSERPEAISAGTVIKVGTDEDLIVSTVSKLLSDTSLYNEVSFAHNPYGDGASSPKIVDILHLS